MVVVGGVGFFLGRCTDCCVFVFVVGLVWHVTRQKRQQQSENDPNRPGVKMKQLEEMGKEDDLELVDKATKRDRDWDNWKDMNTKGYGVTNRI